MITVNPEKRYSAKQLLVHPWLLEGADLLSARNLASTQQELRRFNARRRFKMAVHTVLAVNRLRESVFVPRDDAIEMAMAGDFASPKISVRGNQGTISVDKDPNSMAFVDGDA
jgi:serine/threonine protein kinase